MRFRKSLARPQASADVESLWQANEEKARSDLAVQAKELDALLQDWNVRPAGGGEEWPFTVARRLADRRRSNP